MDVSRKACRLPRSRRSALAAAAFLLLAAGSFEPALAKSDEEATLQSVVPSEIEVASNGAAYTTTPPNKNIVANVHIEIDSGWSGHVKSWEVWLELKAAGALGLEFPEHGANESYPVFQRPHSVDEVEQLLIPSAAYNSYIVAQCNNLADSLRQQGLSDQEIFDEDRNIGLWVNPQLDVDYSGIVNPGFEEAAAGSPPDIQIVCKKWTGSAMPMAGAFQSNFQVTGAKLAISPAYRNLVADCPVTVPLVAEFTSTNAGNLKFRFVSASGKASQLRSVNITGQTNGVFKALHEEHIQVPLAQGGSPAGNPSGGGGIVNQQPGGGLAVQTQPEDPLFPSSPSSSGIGQVQVTPLAGNIHSESFRVEVMDPATGIVSDYAGYRITCKPESAGIATPEALQMQPQPPQPQTQPGTAAIQPGGLATTRDPAAPRQQAPVPALPRAGLTSGLKADIMATTLGFILAGGPNPWGSTVVIDKPQLAAATGVGPRRNLCRFAQAGYRPFNKGDVQSGPFKNKVYRGSATVDQSVHNLAPKQTDGWRTFALELPSGLSVVRVVMDADRQVDESDEDNTFAIRVDVKLDCGGAPKRTTPQRTPQPQRLAPQRQ